MFPTFIGILDIQSWWEVPSIAHFCSLFRAAFNLLDFDIEDLEEALLTDGGSEGRLVQELIVRLLEGCLPNDTRNDISTFNYQMFLRRLFRKKCQEYKCENPFNTDVDFELLPLRQKVEILRALCDFRLDAEDVEQSLSNLDSDSLRVEPLGHDRKNSAYWYFYGTRLYREDYIDTSDSVSYKQKTKSRDKKRKRRRNRVAKEEEEEEAKEEDCLIQGVDKEKESVWQVVCFTQQDWSRLVEKFRDSEHDTERKLYRTLSEDFMPELPKLFDLKEKQQRRKLLQRNSSRVLRSHEPTTQMETVMVRSKIKTKTNKATKKATQTSKAVYVKEETPPLSTQPVQKKGRQTNNSLASAVGQIVIHTRDEVENLEKKKGVGSNSDGNYVSSKYGYKYGYSFGIEEEERRVGMHKVLESLKDHVDAWPFIDPVDEEYAPRYYSVVRKPMDLSTMEDKLEGGSYKTLSQFKRDFRLIVDNCRQYNGSDNEYTEMAVNLKEAFVKAVNRYLESETSSDEDPPSPKSVQASPASPSCPSRVATSPQQNSRKRSKKSIKKSKSHKTASKGKSKSNEKAEEEDKRGKTLKVAKKKRGKKRNKKIKDEESVDDEEEEEEGEEEQESDDAQSEASIATSKKKKQVEANSLMLKTKKLSPKESDDLKKMNKRTSKERHQQKKDAQLVRPIKESKENKKRKEDFEEDYEPLVIAKSKSRKIEKKELEETGICADNTKKSKGKKSESQEDEEEAEEEQEEEEAIIMPEKKEKPSQHIKNKKSRKKEKAGSKALKSDEKSDKNKAKDKNKTSKEKHDEPKNGELSSEADSKDVDLEKEVDSKQSHTTKKVSAFISNKDLESLDGLKDKISERRREEKLKQEKEKQKKMVKSDVHNMYSKKVPSNGSTFHDNEKVSIKRPKLKKGAKEDKNCVAEDAAKTQDQEVSENKKVKVAQAKHAKGFGKEESSAIQALNQATEQTLHDINKWLDDAPRLSEFSSGSDSPIFNPSVESGRPGPKAEPSRKRPSSIKMFGPHGPSRPKKIQRTIDRLQPGKSKGNLLKKPLNLPSGNTSDTAVSQFTSDNDQANKDAEEEPKLSLGTVLKNVDSIQLICKSLVSSPNPNFSNDDEEEDHATLPAVPATSLKEEKSSSTKATTQPPTTAEEAKDDRSNVEEMQKPKTATPNLSAWFKAFGAPKSKKKDEESEENVAKKDGETQEAFCGRQRRMSTGGSSVSESVSSFSQESPPGRSGRSPQGQPVVATAEPQIRGAGFYQDALSTGSSPYNSPYYATPPRYSAQLPPTPSPQNHPVSPAYPSSVSYEQPPLYHQIPPPSTHQTFQKSPQANSGEVYQVSPTFSQRSPQSSFPQTGVPNETYTQQIPPTNQNQSPVYSQHSPQPIPQVYPQPSPQPPPSNYSQPSPQQPPTPKYSQLSPQPNVPSNFSQPSPQAASNYSQASPQQHSSYSQPSPQTPPNYSQPSPQQQHSPYSQPSPQQSSAFTQLSPQPPTNFSQPSPQPPANFSQPSPQPPTVFSQQSPQASNFSQPSPQTHSTGYSQPSPQPLTAYSQASPQPRNYSQPSPQQIPTFPQHSPQGPPPAYSQPSPQNNSYSQSSPQPLTNYSQPSPQQPANYSHPMHSPQTPPSYSQQSPQQAPPPNYSQTVPSPQQPRNYSQPSPSPQQPHNYTQPSPSPQPPRNYSQPSTSPQQSRNYSQSPQQKTTCTPQHSQQPSTYSQLSPQSNTNYAQPQSQPSKASEEYPQSTITPSNYSQGFKQNHSYIQSSAAVPVSMSKTEHRSEYHKPASSEKPSSSEQQQNFIVPTEASLNLNTNHQIYQSPNQYPPAYGNSFPSIDLQRPVSRHSSQEQQQQTPQERPNFTELGESLNAQKYSQSRSFLGKTSNSSEQLPPQDQSQILAFQQNLTAHESLYQTGFQPAPYPMPNTRPVYPSPHYFDTSSKTASSGTSNSSVSNLQPVKKRIYNESAADVSRNLTQEAPSRPGQEQFSFDPMMALPQPEAVPTNQFDGAFVGGLGDPVATNPAYARLGLGLVSRTGKEQQQLLTIPRPPATKPEHLAYARSPASGSAELDLNLLQSLQSAAAKNSQGLLSMSRRVGETSMSSTSAPTRTKKSRKSKQQQQEQQNVTTASSGSTEQQPSTGIPGFPQYAGTPADPIGLKNTTVVPPTGSAFNFAASTSTTTSSPFYDKDATAAAAAFAFLDEFRNPNSYYSMALRQQQQQQQQQQVTPVTDATQPACNKLTNQPPRNYAPHPFLHSAQRSAAYGPPVSAYVTPHGPNLTVDPAAYQQYIHSLYALQPPPHHHRPSWL